MDLGKINPESGTPKFRQIADRIIELIQNGELQLGDRIPSINDVIKTYSVSRDTAVKAYNELKASGTIEAKPNKAYFVANDYFNFDKRVLFLSDFRTPYKELLYNGIIDTLSHEYFVDFFIHGDNFDVLKFIYEKARHQGQYSGFFIIPTGAQNHEAEYFKYINGSDIIFLDRPVPGSGFSAVYQDFQKGFFQALQSEASLPEKNREIVFCTKHYTNPILEEMKEGIQQYASSVNIPFTHIRTEFSSLKSEGQLIPEKGKLYITLDDLLLFTCLDEGEKRGLQPGRDYGLLAVNKQDAFRHIHGGISTISTDFYRMGVEATRMMLEQRPENLCIPTTILPGRTLLS